MDEAMLKSGQYPNVAIMAGTDPAEVMREHGQVIQNGEKYELADTDPAEVMREHGLEGCGGWVEYCMQHGDSLGEALLHTDEIRRTEQADTREQLEADIRAWHRDTPFATKPSVQTLLGWLDRQAAITKRECHESEAWRIGISREAVENGSRISIFGRDYVPADLTACVESTDTREQLEADIAALYAIGAPSENAVLGWLDRQAAITRRETRQRWQDAPCVLDRENLATIAKLTAERDRLQADLDACETREKAADDYDFREAAERWEQAYEDKCGEVVRLTAERDQLSNAINELQKKQPYCYNPEQPLDTLNTIGRYIDELTAERDKLQTERDMLQGANDFLADGFKGIQAERDQLSRDLTAEHALVVQFEQDNEQLKADLEQERTELEAERDFVNQCRTRIDVLTIECERLQKMAKHVASLTAERDLLTIERNRLQAEITELRKESRP